LKKIPKKRKLLVWFLDAEIIQANGQ